MKLILASFISGVVLASPPPLHKNLIIPAGSHADCYPPDESLYDHRFWYLQRDPSNQGGTGVWYTKVAGSLTYDEAVAACSDLGSGLTIASILTEEEKEMTSEIVSSGFTWIGLRRDISEWGVEDSGDVDWADKKKWIWQGSGKSAEYTNWATNMPNNNDAPEDCTVQNWYGNGSGKWDDYPCTWKFSTVCQLECKSQE